MGVDKPLLPAPTDSSFQETTGGSVTGTDLATDVSRRTDRTSYSIPDDGSPVTISTRRRSPRDQEDKKLSRSGQQSQTSLLIEYFEDGKKNTGIQSRPSVRVRVTPSSSRKSKDQSSRVHLSESGSVRKPSYTRRISLGTPTPSRTKELPDTGEEHSVSSLASAAEDTPSGRRPPLEVEFVNQNNSDVSARYMQPMSDISSMPAESTLDSAMAPSVSRRRRTNSISREETDDAPQDDNLLKTPTRTRSRSLSRERIAQKAAEKLAGSGTPRGSSHSKQRSSEERSKRRSQSKDYLEPEATSTRRRSGGKHRDKDLASPESSLLSNSAVSSQHKGGDQHSFRSGTSRSSINNPKLLDTVEDAIRRLILPELKELKKDQKVHSNRTKFDSEANASRASGSIASKDDLGRKLSKHSSAPDVTRHRRSLDRMDKTPSPSSKKKDKHRESRPAKPSSRRTSKDSTGENDVVLHRKKSKGLRDAEAARIVGSRLTSSALQHHDSQSSLDKYESRRKGSKDESRNGSVNETEVIFHKHDVPQMPFRSDINSELTRDSILSQQTGTTAAPLHGEVTRATLDQTDPSTPRTPELSKDLGYQTADTSLSDRGFDDAIYQEEPSDYFNHEYSPHLEPPHAGFAKRRTLSPIQSVASDREDDDALEHEGPLLGPATPSHKGSLEKGERMSIDSLSSAPSTDLARSARAATNSTEKHDHSSDRLEDPSGDHGMGWFDESQRAGNDINDRFVGDFTDFRERVAPSTDGGEEEDPFDPGQNVAKGSAKVVHTPVAVESDVASLFDPSVVDRTSVHSGKSGNNSFTEIQNGHRSWSPQKPKAIDADNQSWTAGSPLKQRQDATSPVEQSFHKRMGVSSPPQSVTKSSSDEFEDRPRMGATGLPNAGSPIPEIGLIPDSEESEINTNPSIIQGPIGGVAHENRDHWPYDPTPPRQTGASISPQSHFNDDELHDDLHTGAKGAGLGLTAEEPTGINDRYDSPTRAEGYLVNDNVDSGPSRAIYDKGYQGITSPLGDEGYISGANHRSASTVTPEPKNKGLDNLDNIPMFGSPLDDEEPFNETSHNRHLSGYSHGMASPLYDSATGRGIDRIQSKDIVALMDHLTVRDAQRNARDTEMLVTLVRSAAEMRNSFEDMKKFIAQQDEMLMEATDKQHEKTQRVIGGPRPLPPSLNRSRQTSTDDEDEMRSKRKNVFKRALRGLTMKNSNELTNIEDMLVHLLSEMEGLRATQEGRPIQTDNSGDCSPLPEGYASQGQPEMASPENQHGLSPHAPQNSGDAKVLRSQRDTGRRISPVMEGDEDQEPLTPTEQEVLNNQMATEAQLTGRHKRGGSLPLGTPERVPVATGALSNDTTPRRSNEKNRKHKSSNSSFFPKISRWSKTTASSMGDNIRNTMQSGRKERPLSEMSRSGSDLGQYTTGDYYDHQGDDRLRSNTSLEHDKQENRPPSPLVPSQVSENPRYQAHRDSLNLQHPQPRQGPTARYQNHLETEAQNFGPYASPKSEAWTSNPSIAAVQTDANARRRSSPMSDGGYSATSSATGKQNPPPRPPKVRDEGPLVPQRPPKSADGTHPSYADRMAMRDGPRSNVSRGPNGSTTSAPQRKPTGPRPYTSSGRYGTNHSGGFPKRQQYRGSPNQVDDDDY